MSVRWLPILCYHRISELPTADPLYPHSVSPTAFTRQMEYLAARGYRTARLSDLVRNSTCLGHRRVILTFDDGYLDNYEVALPILRQYGFEATIFLVSRYLQPHTDGASQPAPMLSPDHVLEMVHGGVEFGSHGRTHRPLTELSDPEVRDEVAGSRQDLQGFLDRPVLSFAYPYGLSSPGIQRVVRECGYGLAVAVGNGMADRYNLRRIAIGRNQNMLDFAWKVSGLALRLRRLVRPLYPAPGAFSTTRTR